jgi:hypothetical protein
MKGISLVCKSAKKFILRENKFHENHRKLISEALDSHIGKVCGPQGFV